MSLRFGCVSEGERARCRRCGWVLARFFVRPAKAKGAKWGEYECRDRERCRDRARETAERDRAALETRR